MFAPLLLLFVASCGPGRKVHYDMKGSNIPADVKSFTVDFFTNEAQLVNPNLSISFTEKLKTKFQTNTKLILSTENGDYHFSGAVKEYSVAPATINSNSGATQNKFTITIMVKFECPLHPEKNFNQPFTTFRTFDAGKDFNSVETALADEITDNLVQNVFSATALDW